MASILIIDDDPQVLAMLEQRLTRQGYEVVQASDGKSGVRIYRENPTDIVITDLIMPKKEGIETIMEIKKDFPEVKIIAISGGGRVGSAQYLDIAKAFGARYIFAKPVEMEELLQAINELLE
jgi:DNA-binding NtrC family response regulator